MKTTKIKTSELTGAALDWAVAKCEQPGYEDWRLIRWIEQEFSPSANWAQGGPIIEREEICVLAPVRNLWRGRKNGHTEYGPTPLIAAMRAIVASQLGDEVEVPTDLLTNTN